MSVCDHPTVASLFFISKAELRQERLRGCGKEIRTIVLRLIGSRHLC